MKILIAANAFKNSLSAVAACEAIKKGLEKRYPNHQYDLCPVCDGGDGTCEVISLSIGAETRKINTTGLFNEPIVSEYGYQKDICPQRKRCGHYLQKVRTHCASFSFL